MEYISVDTCVELQSNHSKGIYISVDTCVELLSNHRNGIYQLTLVLSYRVAIAREYISVETCVEIQSWRLGRKMQWNHRQFQLCFDNMLTMSEMLGMLGANLKLFG